MSQGKTCVTKSIQTLFKIATKAGGGGGDLHVYSKHHTTEDTLLDPPPKNTVHVWTFTLCQKYIGAIKNVYDSLMMLLTKMYVVLRVLGNVLFPKFSIQEASRTQISYKNAW